jgi:prevent-host-death family protein
MELVGRAFEARQKFGKLLRDVQSMGNPIVVERNGEPVAAVIPIDLYRSWKRERDALFASIRSSGEYADLSEEEAMELALEAQRWARTQN